MNNYESQKNLSAHPINEDWYQRRIGPGIIASIMILAVLFGYLQQVIPWIGAYTKPRIGWLELIFCMNPLIFLLPYLWTPTRSALVSSAYMTYTMGMINVNLLLSTGTVSIVTNEYDRLHSSWLWSVLPFLIAGGYLHWLATRIFQNPINTRRRTSHARQPAITSPVESEIDPPVPPH